jgi:hypothetical protein
MYHCYFVPENVAKLSEGSKSLYFDQSFRHVSEVATDECCYEIGIKVLESCNLGGSVPLRRKGDRAIIDSIREDVPGVIIQITERKVSKVETPDSFWKKKIPLSEEQVAKVIKQFHMRFAKMTPPEPDDSDWIVREGRKTLVQFDSKDPQKVESSQKVPGQKEWHQLCQKLHPIISQIPLWPKGPPIHKSAFPFIDFVLLATLEGLTKDLKKGKIVEEEIEEQLAIRFSEDLKGWRNHSESLFYEQLEEIAPLCSASKSNIQELKTAFGKDWQPGERRRLESKALSDQDVAAVQTGIPAFLENAEVKALLKSYFNQVLDK